MLTKTRVKNLEKQGYRIVGNHSAIKVCLWTKKAIVDKDICYKSDFYGINSHRCVQMTPSFVCSHRCNFCWRDIDFTPSKWEFQINKPKDIIDDCIESQREILQGFGGNSKINKKRFEEAIKPLHFAISLTAEPTYYAKLPELINELKRRKITSFLVTNGTNTNMLKKLIKKQPTQLYITLPAPNKEIYQKVCNPLIKDGWKRINESLKLLKSFKRGTIRMTLVKDMNMIYPEQYVDLLKKVKFKFLEIKAGMVIGYARYRMGYEQMPLHKEIKEFARKICKLNNLKIIDEKENSRVVLLMKEDSEDRKLKFN